MNQVKVGVIGLGRMGQQHCRIYSSLRRAQLMGVCDINPEIGRQAARRFDVPFFSNPDDLIESVEAISLVTPTPAHFDIAMRCLERGLPVLIEKPIAETIEQAEKLVKLVETKGLICQIGHIERFNPAYVELKNVLDGMTLLAVNFRRLSAYAGSNTDVDVALDLMIHDADLVLDLIGKKPSSITAAGISAYGKAVDYATAQLQFENGPLLSMTASRLTEEKIRSVDVTTLDAFLEANLLNKAVTLHRRTISQYLNSSKQNIKYRQESIIESVLVPVVEPLLSELQHFIDCVIENKKPLVTPRDGLNALQLVYEIRDLIQQNLFDFSQKEGLIKEVLIPVNP
jgi:predicted dehydrogenase